MRDGLRRHAADRQEELLASQRETHRRQQDGEAEAATELKAGGAQEPDARQNRRVTQHTAKPTPEKLAHRGLGFWHQRRAADEIEDRLQCQNDYGSAAEPSEHDSIEGLDHFDKVINVDQGPIGRTPRSNPATYTGLFTPIRDLFAGVPESRARGYEAGRFSFNVKGGRCEACQGDGVIKVEMHFLPDVYVPCDVCKSKRYNRETLDIKYKGKNISEVLSMTVENALSLFQPVPSIARKLETIHKVGLSYITLGQSATTLSGGEAQRIKLSRELSKRDTGQTLYILDEPTTGLHFHDIELLLGVLHALRDAGNTVVVIEHNLDVIKTADWVIDLGPEPEDPALMPAILRTALARKRGPIKPALLDQRVVAGGISRTHDC